MGEKSGVYLELPEIEAIVARFSKHGKIFF
jgi:hypothetical protein